MRQSFFALYAAVIFCLVYKRKKRRSDNDYILLANKFDIVLGTSNAVILTDRGITRETLIKCN